MRRYWLENSQIQGSEGIIDGDEFHHIVDVCRQNKGSRFEILTDGQFAHLVELIEVRKKSARFKILESRTVQELPLPRFHLCLSVPRFPVFESLLEKMVELGVYDIHLFFSEFSFVRTQGKISKDKFERWARIIKSSTQQSGRGDLMKLHEPVEFNALFEKINLNAKSLCLFAYEGEPMGLIESRSLTAALENIEWKKIEDLHILVGSEGGFSTQEANFIKEKGHQAVNLGSQILRVETACVALVSILKYLSQRR